MQRHCGQRDCPPKELMSAALPKSELTLFSRLPDSPPPVPFAEADGYMQFQKPTGTGT